MSLLTGLRAGIATANKITKPLQATVQFRHFVGASGTGERMYLPPEGEPAIELLAIVDWKQKHLRTPTGELTVSRASVLFLDIVALRAATTVLDGSNLVEEGINDQDMIILPDGSTGPIIDMGGFIDADTGHPVYTEVWLG